MYQKSNWIPWGLSCLSDSDAIAKAEKSHDLVANYLVRHPEEHIRWRKNGPYFDILNKAEKELDK